MIKDVITASLSVFLPFFVWIFLELISCIILMLFLRCVWGYFLSRPSFRLAGPLPEVVDFIFVLCWHCVPLWSRIEYQRIQRSSGITTSLATFLCCNIYPALHHLLCHLTPPLLVHPLTTVLLVITSCERNEMIGLILVYQVASHCLELLLSNQEVFCVFIAKYYLICGLEARVKDATEEVFYFFRFRDDLLQV